MSFVCGFWLSLAVVVITLFAFVFSRFSKKPVKKIYILILGFFVATVFAFIPLKNNGFEAIHSTFRAVVIDMDMRSEVTDYIWASAGEYALAYSAYMSTLLIALPLVSTFGIIFIIFGHFLSYVIYLALFFMTPYVFSELNEKSLALAKDLKKGEKRIKKWYRLIVFCNCADGSDGNYSEMLDEAKRLGAIFLNKDILHYHFEWMHWFTPLYFFVVGSDYNKNMSHAVELKEEYGDRKNSFLYYFASDAASGVLLHKLTDSNMIVRRVNEKQSLIYNELYLNPNDVFESYYEDGTGTKRISAVVVGMGEYGTEMLRTLTWYCQMDGYKVEINAFDMDPLAESKFKALCPDLLDPRYNDVEVDGEAYYKIAVHSGVEINTDEFVKHFQQVPHPTYVFISLGDDERNIEAAINIRKICKRMHVEPKICAVVFNTKLANTLTDAKNHRGEAYDITYIGNLDRMYSEDVVLNSPIEKQAVDGHSSTFDARAFWQYEYNYNSSVAGVIHRAARDRCASFQQLLEGKSKEERDDICSQLEHRRWDAYMRSQGFIYSGSDHPSSRIDVGKMHNCLIPYAQLSDAYKAIDRNMASRTSKK